jgi:hypothetical protein
MFEDEAVRAHDLAVTLAEWPRPERARGEARVARIAP